MDDIPIEIIQMLVFVLQAYIEEDNLLHVDNIICRNGEINNQRLQQVRNILTERMQFRVLEIFQRALEGKEKISAGCCNESVFPLRPFFTISYLSFCPSKQSIDALRSGTRPHYRE